MKYRHDLMLQKELTKRAQQVNNSLDSLSMLTEKLDPDGQPTALSLEEIKTVILAKSNWIAKRTALLSNMVKNYTDADYLGISGKTSQEWTTLLDDTGTQIKEIPAALELVNNDRKLSDLAQSVPDNDALTEVKMSEEVLNANRINNYLDAAYYTLRGINEHDGSDLNKTDAELRGQALIFLAQIHTFPIFSLPDLIQDVAEMKAVGNYVEQNIADDLLDLSDYIGLQVEKLPLARRMWANG